MYWFINLKYTESLFSTLRAWLKFYKGDTKLIRSVVYLPSRWSRLPSNPTTIHDFKQIPMIALTILLFGSCSSWHTWNESVQHLHCAPVVWSADTQRRKARKGNRSDATRFVSMHAVSIFHLKERTMVRWDHTETLSSFLALPDKASVT